MDQKEFKNNHPKVSSELLRLLNRAFPIFTKSFTGIDNLLEFFKILPVVLHFEEYENNFEKDKDFHWKKMAIGGYIAVEQNSTDNSSNLLKVNLKLMKPQTVNGEKFTWEKFSNELVSSEFMNYQLVFVYFHEILHILNNHYNYYQNKSFISFIKSLDKKKKFKEEEYHSILNMAQDYFINSAISDGCISGTPFENHHKNKHFNALYLEKYNFRDMTIKKIAEDLVKNAKIKEETIEMELSGCDCDGEGEGEGKGDKDGEGKGDKDGEGKGEKDGEGKNKIKIKKRTVDINGVKSTTYDLQDPQKDEGEGKGKGKDNSGNLNGESMQEIFDSLKKRISNRSSTGFSDLGVSTKVPIDWFKYLKNSIFDLCQTQADQIEPTYTRRRFKYDHILPKDVIMPGFRHYKKRFGVIISIDQSGSMSDDDLKKINYIIEHLSKKSTYIEILIHDTAIINTKKFEQGKIKNLSNYIQTRVAQGGTSHREIFEYIHEKRKAEKEVTLAYMSFSDNYSDIKECYNVNTFKNMSCYWIITQDGIKIDVPGLHISLESGLLV